MMERLMNNNENKGWAGSILLSPTAVQFLKGRTPAHGSHHSGLEGSGMRTPMTMRSQGIARTPMTMRGGK